MPDLRIFLFWLELFVTLALCVSAKIRGSAGLLHILFFCVSWLVVLNGVETGQRSWLAVLNGGGNQSHILTSCVEWGENQSQILTSCVEWGENWSEILTSCVEWGGNRSQIFTSCVEWGGNQSQVLTSCVEWGGNRSQIFTSCVEWGGNQSQVLTSCVEWGRNRSQIFTSCVEWGGDLLCCFNVCYSSSHYTKQHMWKADITAEDWFRTLVWHGPPWVVVGVTQRRRMTHIYPSSLKDSELSRRREGRNKNNHNGGHLGMPNQG